jgi:hypothetical protein
LSPYQIPLDSFSERFSLLVFFFFVKISTIYHIEKHFSFLWSSPMNKIMSLFCHKDIDRALDHSIKPFFFLVKYLFWFFFFFFFCEISISKKISDDELHHPWLHMLSYKKRDVTTQIITWKNIVFSWQRRCTSRSKGTTTSYLLTRATTFCFLNLLK